MVKKYALSATKRENVKNSARDARDANRIPSVVYGHGVDPISISVDYSEFLKLFRKTGQAALIDLDVEGKKIQVLVSQYDMHPVTDTFVHIDFFAVNIKEASIVHVPLIFEGESEAVKTLNGTLMTNQEELTIRCLPSDIPHDITVDISSITELAGCVTIDDLNLPDTLEIMGLEGDTPVCTVVGHTEVEDKNPEPMEGAEEGTEGEEGNEGEEEKEDKKSE